MVLWNARGYDTAYILAGFFEFFFIAIGLMVLFRKNQTTYFDQFVESREYLFITGLMTLMLGAIIVALNNTWTFDWRLLITILGWATFLKGAMILIFPEFSVSIWKNYQLNRAYEWSALSHHRNLSYLDWIWFTTWRRRTTAWILKAIFKRIPTHSHIRGRGLGL